MILKDDRLYISIEGLSFNDIIYWQEMDGHSELDVAFNSSYMTAISQVSDP